MCSCGVLWSLKPDGALADGDDELHPGLPHRALGRHGPADLATPVSDCCCSNPPRGPLLEVSLFIFMIHVMSLVRVIPESPSWLLVKGRQDEAISQLSLVARCNSEYFQVCTIQIVQ